MPMIKCPDCGSSVSDRLSNCPTCGAPIAKKSERYSQFYQKSQTFLPEPRYEEPEERPRRKKFSKSTALSISAIFISFMAFLTSFMAIAIASSKPKEVVVEKEVPVYQEVAEKIVSEESGTIGIEAKIVESEPAGIEDFDYELSEDKVLLKKYIGNCETVIIPYFYNVDGSDYLTDLTHFQIGIGNRDAKTVIICEGIADVFDAMFNSCNVDTVYFPKSMNVVYDKTLSYLHPKGEDKIKIYYGGTREEWENIFTVYNGKDIESAGDAGVAAADKINEMIGTEYDSSKFEFFFSTNVNDLSYINNSFDVNREASRETKEENSVQEERGAEEADRSSTQKDNIFYVGDTLETKKIRLSYISCGDYTDDNMFVEAGENNKLIYFEFEFENIGNTDTSVGFYDFDCYADGYEAKNSMCTADNAMTSITTLSPGRRMGGIVVFEVPKNADNIEIEYETSFWTQDKAIFIYG